jgi:CheY-like chemotaxis protein
MYMGFRMTEQPFQPDDKPETVAPRQSRKTPYVILLMDDELSILEPFKKLLEINGYIVYTACDGEQAVAIYRHALSSRQKVDVAIIDLTIPEGMGGLEAVARIKAFDPDIRAIATTGHFQEYLTDEYKKSGFVGILPKPYVLKELIEAINQVIARETKPPG